MLSESYQGGSFAKRKKGVLIEIEEGSVKW